MYQSLRGKVALVSGSAHRVGKAIALELARRGAHQIIHYSTSEAEAIQTVSEIEAIGVKAIRFRADQTDPAQIEALFKTVQDNFGRLDVLVNSAASFEQTDLLTLSLADWQRVLATNLTAAFLCSQHAVLLMRLNGGGVIVNIADESAKHGSKTFAAHSVAKAALLMLSEVSALSFAPDVRVNTVIPGMVLKPTDYNDDQWQKAYSNTPLRRPGSAEDVARAVAYLAEEDFLSGTVLNVDAGAGLG